MQDRQPHLLCGPGDVAPHVLLPGDPGRVHRVKAFLSAARDVASNREFTTVTGTFQGVPVTCTSTGIGGPSLAIAFHELRQLGVRLFIRIGSAGALQPGLEVGDLVVAECAERQDGTGDMYAPRGYPAAADYRAVEALAEAASEVAARDGELRFRIGAIRSHDSFYTPEESRLTQAGHEAGLLASDMETATLFVLARRSGAVAGSVLNVVVPWGTELEAGVQRLASQEARAARGERAEIEVALLALHKLAARIPPEILQAED